MHERLALLELLTRGTIKQRRGQAAPYNALAELPWTRATGRRNEIALVDARRSRLVTLLERVWPGWRDGLAELTARGLPPTPEGWSRLMDERRAEGIPELPDRLNRRTAAAFVAPHSKASLTDARLSALGDTQATHDGTVRLRPPAGLCARSARGDLDLSAIASVLGEIAIPERAFLDGLQFEGSLHGVLLVENLGAWRDVPAPDGWLLAHVPGWDTATVHHLLERLAHIPAVHFGDLDPNGVRIFIHLRERNPRLRWLVPPFWAELIETHSQRAPWPEELDLADTVPLVRELAVRGLWLEQERIVLDPRLLGALSWLVSATPC